MPPANDKWQIAEPERGAELTLQPRTSAVDQKPAQILVAALGYPAQAMFAAGGILPWHQTQPGRELAPTAETARFYHCGGEGCGNDRADARNARQALADGVALVPGHELLLDRRNRRRQLLNLCRQHLEHLPRQVRQPRVALT